MHEAQKWTSRLSFDFRSKVPQHSTNLGLLNIKYWPLSITPHLEQQISLDRAQRQTLSLCIGEMKAGGGEEWERVRLVSVTEGEGFTFLHQRLWQGDRTYR